MKNFRVNGCTLENHYPECLGEFSTLLEAEEYAMRECEQVAVGKDADGDYVSMEVARLMEKAGQPATGKDILYISECSWAEVIDINTEQVVARYGDK